MSAAPERSKAESLLDYADQLQRQAPALEAQTPSPELHLVTFVLDREEFGVPIGQVREVIRVSDITRVP